MTCPRERLFSILVPRKPSPCDTVRRGKYGEAIEAGCPEELVDDDTGVRLRSSAQGRGVMGKGACELEYFRS